CEPRCFDLHESSPPLSRGNILSGRFSARRFRNDFAGGAQPKLYCALRGVRDCRRRSPRAIWLSSRRIFATTTGGSGMKCFLPWIILAVAAALIFPNWVPTKTTTNDFDFSGFEKIRVLVGGGVKPLA